ncbi:hypothetical protein [Nostoc commune]|nr:hypothetical protein [Nostoc commune BAE]
MLLLLAIGFVADILWLGWQC